MLDTYNRCLIIYIYIYMYASTNCQKVLDSQEILNHIMSDFAWANRDFLTISAVFQAIDLWAYATNEKYNWKTRGGSRKNIFVPFAPTGGNVLQYKASYRIFNLESVKHRFSLQCRWYAHVDCGFLSLSWNSISTACTAAQLKNPAHVDVAVAPKVAHFTSVHFKEPQIDATKSTWREPLMFLLEFPLLELKQLWKNWTKDDKRWEDEYTV